MILWPDRLTLSATTTDHPCQVRNLQLGPRDTTLKLQIPEEVKSGRVRDGKVRD